jgi:phosphoribosyl-ATP pyrophosphohydrolase/phosphoribosyl-AMP cyclohydrolase
MTVTARIDARFEPGDLAYDDRGLVPVVVQEVASGAVLMLAWADRAAVERTLATGRAHFWSRSRQASWMKGETSGNVLHVVDVRRDCDGDSLLYRADAAGPTCHTGVRSCFETEGGATGVASSGPAWELGWLDQIVAARRHAPADESYTARLLAAGVDRCARKLGEEATETVIAALRAEAAGEGDAEAEAVAEARTALVGEAADLAYHLLVLLAAAGGDAAAVAAELRRRHVAPRPPAPKPEAATADAASQTPATDTP